MRFRRLAVPALAIAIVAACGARTDDVASPSAPPDEPDSAAATPPDAAAGSSDAPADVALPPVDAATITVRPPPVSIRPLDGGVVCVFVDPDSFDRSCNSADDCAYIAVGTLCSNDCVASCGTTYVNVEGLARYRQAVASFPPLDCNCPAESVASCVRGRCTP